MHYQIFSAPFSWRSRFSPKPLVAITAILVCLSALSVDSLAQMYKTEIDTGERVSLSVKSRNGRVSVIASDEQQKKVSIEATSTGLPVGSTDVVTAAKGGSLNIDVRPRREQDRIDLIVRIPSRSKVSIESEGGAVDVVGNVEIAEVRTNTGTIHADVPLDALKFSFDWEASRPRFLSDVQLPEIKEKRGGVFTISGKLGEKKAKKEDRVELAFQTQRGVVLLNVDPSMAPSDLRERPLTEAARAIVRSGDSELIEAIRKVSPKMFGDYAKTLPPLEKEPSLVNRRPPGQIVTSIAPQLLRFTASVTDRNGRAIGDMKRTDFSVYEDGVERRVTDVVPASEPFNLVLLLDVSGSVEERMDFIRKAALYDALGYVLSDTMKPLRGERTAVVILSDGDDNKSFVPFPALLEATVESGALIYPLYVPSGLVPEASVPRPEITIDPLRTRYLTLTTRAEEEGRKLATVSGGVYYPIRRIEDLQRAYDDVVLQLRTAYTITYASNSTPSGSRRVRVRANREGASIRLSPVVSVATP